MSDQSWRDKLKASQKTRVSLEFVATVYPKMNQTTNVPELLYVKKGEDPVVFPFIHGFLVGEYQKLGAYNNSLKKGGNSTPYFTKEDTVTAFEGQSRIFSGKVADTKEYMAKYFDVKNAKSIKVFVLATSKGLVAVETNAVLAMRDSRKIKAYKDDYLVKFTAKYYTPAEDWEKGMMEDYRTLQLRPTFALPSQGILLTEEIESQIKVGEAVDSFLEFKKYIEGNRVAHDIPEAPEDEDNERVESVAKNQYDSSLPPITSFDEDDDLPF